MLRFSSLVSASFGRGGDVSAAFFLPSPRHPLPFLFLLLLLPPLPSRPNPYTLCIVPREVSILSPLQLERNPSDKDWTSYRLEDEEGKRGPWWWKEEGTINDARSSA